MKKERQTTVLKRKQQQQFDLSLPEAKHCRALTDDFE